MAMIRENGDYRIKEAAIEFNCSERLVQNLIKTGSIKVYKIGAAVRIPREEIERIKKAAR